MTLIDDATPLEQRPTARARAERICPINRAVRNQNHATNCSECKRVIDEIEVAIEQAQADERARWVNSTECTTDGCTQGTASRCEHCFIEHGHAAVAAAREERDCEWRYQVYMALEHEVSGTP